MHSQFTDWLDRRKPQEEKLLRAYQDNMRISRDDDTRDIGVSRAQKSKVFIGSTRSKIRSSRSKIKDVMFGNGQMPFDTKPSNEDLAKFADAMEAILNVQLREAKFQQTIDMGTDSLCTYGTGFIFGPFVHSKNYTEIQDTEQGLSEPTTYSYDC